MSLSMNPESPGSHAPASPVRAHDHRRVHPAAPCRTQQRRQGSAPALCQLSNLIITAPDALRGKLPAQDDPWPGQPRWAKATLRNPETGLAFELAYRQDTLPHFFLWYKMGEGAYVIGFEPSTVEREPSRAPDTLSYLDPGAEVGYELRLRALDGVDR